MMIKNISNSKHNQKTLLPAQPETTKEKNIMDTISHNNERPNVQEIEEVTSCRENHAHPNIATDFGADSNDNDLITFSNITYNLPDGVYQATVSQSKIITKNDGRRWLLGFILDGTKTEFLANFPILLNKFTPFGKEIYSIRSQVTKLLPEVVFDHRVSMQIKNHISDGRQYSNIIQFYFIDSDEDE